MSGRGHRGHPDKRKHANAPRPLPATPLTAEERALKSGAEFGKALRLLAEAERLAAWGEAPSACIHSAYYAMYHCASASILAAGGVGKRQDAPASHEHVSQHFGRLVSEEGGELSGTGLLLARARSDRMAADYGLGLDATDGGGGESVAAARHMIALCQARWGLVPPEDER